MELKSVGRCLSRSRVEELDTVWWNERKCKDLKKAFKSLSLTSLEHNACSEMLKKLETQSTGQRWPNFYCCNRITIIQLKHVIFVTCNFCDTNCMGKIIVSAVLQRGQQCFLTARGSQAQVPTQSQLSPRNSGFPQNPQRWRSGEFQTLNCVCVRPDYFIFCDPLHLLHNQVLRSILY